MMKIEQPQIETLKSLIGLINSGCIPASDEIDCLVALQFAIDQLEWRGMESAPNDRKLKIDVIAESPSGGLCLYVCHADHVIALDRRNKCWRPRPAVPEVCDER